ncbi:kinesin-like protein KIN-14R [Wolffia australiana]
MPKEDQSAVYDDVSPLVVSVLDGFNMYIFVYKQMGTRKTFTMEGPEHNRAFSYDVTINILKVKVKKLLKIRDSIASSSMLSKKLKVEQVNKHNSRFHRVLGVRVKAKSLVNGDYMSNKLWLLDLALIERLVNTHTQGERLRGVHSINKSLCALDDVIYVLAYKSSHVPYRNSKLTHLLQDSLADAYSSDNIIASSPRKEVQDPWAFYLHAALLRQAFAHCEKFPTAASRRSLGRVSVPEWLIILSDQLLIIALVCYYLTN